MSKINSTFMASPKNIVNNHVIIDVSGLKVGRVASEVAKVLRGKHKPYYTPHQNCGDYVIIINADKLDIAESKLEGEIFYWYTGYVGGIKSRKWKEMSRTKLMENAIRRMMPKESPLARIQLGKMLRIYGGAEHPHAGQKPVPYKIEVKAGKGYSATCIKTGEKKPFSIKGFCSTSVRQLGSESAPSAGRKPKVVVQEVAAKELVEKVAAVKE